jgi:hypothetical protein
MRSFIPRRRRWGPGLVLALPALLLGFSVLAKDVEQNPNDIPISSETVTQNDHSPWSVEERNGSPHIRDSIHCWAKQASNGYGLSKSGKPWSQSTATGTGQQRTTSLRMLEPIICI